MSDATFYLTPKELATRWRLSDQTLANWRHAGKGPRFIRVGTRVLYPLQGIIHFEQIDQCSPEHSQASSDATPN